MSSRRRKGGDRPRLRSPSAPETRSSRRRAAAAAAGGWQDDGAEAGPGPGSKAEESCLYKTPKRSLNSKSRLPIFSSPANDTDVQQEIFWDPHSPITHKLDNERKKQDTSRHPVEISDIVNRIAPQDEKPGCSEGSLLGIWIGENAIPCTPEVGKIRSRTKLNGIRDHKIKNTEEELMKLAKQFDKNLVEQDIVQEQDDHFHGFIPTTSEAETLNNYKDAQAKNLQSFLSEDSEAETVLSLKPVKESTGIPATEYCQTSSQKSLDLEAEVALNALFDCSTQKCSGQLSQGLSAISLNNSFHESKSTLVEENHAFKEGTGTEQHIAEEMYEKQSSCALESVNQIAASETKNTLVLPQQSLTPPRAESLISRKPAEMAPDNLDDWDFDLLADDFFIMQIPQNPELISSLEEALPVPKKSSAHVFSGFSTANTRNTSSSLSGISLSAKSKSIQYAPPKQNSKAIQDSAKSLCFQKPDKEMENSKRQTDFLHGEPDVKIDKINSTWKSTQNKVSDYNSVVSEQSDIKNGKEHIQSKFGPTSFPVKGSSSILVSSNLHKMQTGKYGNNKCYILPQSSVPANAKPKDLVKGVTCTGLANLKQAEMPKKCAGSFSDWNEPKFSDEVLDMFCESDSLWDTNDDDLLYQVCDDVEKQTQTQDIKQGNERAIIMQAASIASKPDGGNSLTASTQGLNDHPLAQKINTNQHTISKGTPHTNFSKVTDRLTVFGNGMNSSSADPTALTAKAPTQHRCAHSQNYNQNASANATNTVPGKWYRSNSVPAGNLSSEICPVNATNRCSSAAINSRVLSNQDLSQNTGKISNNSCMNKMSVAPSKFTFKKINSSEIAVHVDPKSIHIGDTSGIKVIQQGLEESKNQLNIPLHEKSEIHQKPPFKRHFSESYAESTTAFMMEQKNRKCSQEEIERKKQEALARRRTRMQAFLKDM